MAEGPTRRAAMIGGLLMAAGAGAIAAQPRTFERKKLQTPLDTLIPRAIGGWRVDGSTGLILPEADTLDETLECLKADGTVAKLHQKWFGIAPAADAVAVNPTPGHGVPGFAGYDDKPHDMKCS